MKTDYIARHAAIYLIVISAGYLLGTFAGGAV